MGHLHRKNRVSATTETSARKAQARRPRPLLIAGAASVSAGAVHAAAIGAHADHPQAARMFAIVAFLQVAWGVAAIVSASRLLAIVGLVLNFGLVAGWVLAKWKGIWFVSGLD